MKVLVLGGSVFLGRAVVEAALVGDHQVTVLNRGVSGANPSGVATIIGDRNVASAMAAARSGGPWDLVVDTSGFEPETVALSGETLGDSCAHYLFVSTVSAFADWPALPVSDGSPLLPFVAADRTYGASKAECERVLAARLGDRLSVVYPGVIIGPHENVGRLPWWLARHALGGDIVYPGLDVHISPIDVRDLASFMINLAEVGRTGARNIAAGEIGAHTLGDLMRLCAEVTGASVRPIHIGDELLIERGVEPWTDLPLWAPRGIGADAIWETESSPAREAGLRHRPLKATVADTWEWMRSVGVTTDSTLLPFHKAVLGLSADLEAKLLA